MEQIAFKDFKTAVSVKEFEVVLSLCKKKYDTYQDLLERRHNFYEKSKEKLEEVESSFLEQGGVPDEKAKMMRKSFERLIERAEVKYTEELLKVEGDNIDEIAFCLTEFLNKFTNEKHEELDFSFVKQFKK